MNSPHNVLFMTDRRHQHSADGDTILRNALQSAGISVTLTEAPSAVAQLASGKFDCVLLYTQGETFDASQVEALSKFVKNGGGLVGLHSATATNKTDDAYARLLGSRFAGHGPVFSFNVTVLDKEHPIAHRIGDFRIEDELYLLEPMGEFQTFLTAWWNGKQQPMGYSRREGKGKVVYLALGHHAASLSNKVFQQILSRSIRYAAGEDWSKETVKVAAIGYGGAFNMGKLHLESCNKARMKAVAVCDTDEKRHATARQDLGEAIQTYSRVDDLLSRSDTEMCIVITPHNTHAPLSIQCLKAGRHVVTEKPYTITVEEATQVIETARTAKKMATVFHNRRWDGDFLTIRRLVESGVIGDVFAIECCMANFNEPTPTWWRSYKDISGGIMHDWGAHFWDWMLQLMPHKIESIRGDFRKGIWSQVTIEDHAVATVRFEGGRTAQLEMSHMAAIGKSRFRILGTKGGIEQKGWDEKDGITLVTFDNGKRIESKVPCEKSDWDAFYRNVADHLILGELLAVTPESARRVIAAISVAEQSSKQGGVPLPAPFEQ